MNPKLEWREVPEFIKLCEKIIDKYPDKFSGLDANWIIAWECVNRDKKSHAKPFKMTGTPEPESFTNSKKYFVHLWATDWALRSIAQKAAIAFAVLQQIDGERPELGKVLGFDYKDQGVLVRTFGPDWHDNKSLPNILTDKIDFVEIQKEE